MSFMDQTMNTPAIAAVSSGGSGCEEEMGDSMLVRKETRGSLIKRVVVSELESRFSQV